MIKKLQALKAKKGFTLVELIVVIAIIGVLAAILVPTLLGVVTKSRVTSANSTAASIKSAIGSFLTSADSDGYGMKGNPDKHDVVEISVSNDGKWSITGITTDNYKAKKGNNGQADLDWASSVTNVDATTTRTGADPTTLLAMELQSTFPDMKRAAIVAVLKGGSNCTFVAYSADLAKADELKTEVDNDNLYDTTSFDPMTVSAWDGKNAGISSTNGYTVGTAPAVGID